jgi:N,N'-diacetyllegionaminate synthase
MKINLIGEIGLNHLGNKKYLEEYQNILSKNKIDGISIQIPQKSLMDNSQKKFLLTDSKITEFVISAKKKFKLVGITTSDKTKINFFNKLNIDFFKVTSGMISNINLIKKMQKSKIKKIYLSTGFSNYVEIDKILKKVTKKKISLIHTSFKNKNNEINLRRILILKEKFNLPVAYGNHSIILETLSNAVFYEPEALFFYIKLNKKIKYPDHNHAIKLSELKNIIKKIKSNIDMSGAI